MINRMELLKLIKNNAKLCPKEIAVMLGTTEADVENELRALSEEGIILGYTTQINWEKTERESVIAMIEVKLSPMRNKGYDHIANLLCKYDKVSSCYLVSGDYDLMLIYEDDNLREIASFISEKIAPLEGVLSTKSHCILKKYKIDGIITYKNANDDRQTVIL